MAVSSGRFSSQRTKNYFETKKKIKRRLLTMPCLMDIQSLLVFVYLTDSFRSWFIFLSSNRLWCKWQTTAPSAHAIITTFGARNSETCKRGGWNETSKHEIHNLYLSDDDRRGKTSWPLSSISFPSLNNFRTTNKFAPKANTHKDKNLTNRRTADLVRILNLVDRQDTSSTYYYLKEESMHSRTVARLNNLMGSRLSFTFVRFPKSPGFCLFYKRSANGKKKDFHQKGTRKK